MLEQLVEANKCPKCNADLEYYDTSEIIDDEVTYKCECPECGWSGIEYHKLVFAGFYSKDDSDFIQARSIEK